MCLKYGNICLKLCNKLSMMVICLLIFGKCDSNRVLGHSSHILPSSESALLSLFITARSMLNGSFFILIFVLKCIIPNINPKHGSKFVT